MGSLDEQIAALAERYREGQFTETVYRASLYAKGIRGADIDQIVRDTNESIRKIPAGNNGPRP